MDSQTIANLNRKDRRTIQRCRLYLQIATISDIASLDGTSINPNWLQPNTPKPSKSLAKWPRQGNPGKRAWMLWSRILKLAFLNKHGKLKTPLGNWTTNHSEREWKAYVTMEPTILYMRHNDKWTLHRLIHQQRLAGIFDKQSDTTIDTLPSTAVPIDIINQKNGRIITERICQERLKLSTTPISKENTIDQWIQGSVHRNLLENTTMLLDSEVLQNSVLQSARFDIATDGSHDPSTRIAAFGWAISVNSELLAKGQGPAPAHSDMSNPFRAEAYGVAAALAFLEALSKYLQLDPRSHNWHLYIDNTALINRIKWHDEEKCSAKMALLPDVDITLLIHQLLKPLPMQIEHVTSSKRNTNNNPAAWHELLHDIADALATQYRTTMDTPDSNVISHAYRILKIQDVPVTRHHQRWIMQFASSVPILGYYETKYGWTGETVRKIDWNVQYKALNSFSTSDQTRILKFVHGWLPTNKRLHREKKLRTPKCQLCHDLVEDNLHLFQCKHPAMKESREKISTVLTKDQQIIGDPSLSSIIIKALTFSLTSEEWTPTLGEESSPSLRAAIIDQDRIGWQHILYGRLATSMITHSESYFRHNNESTSRFNGKQWGRKTITAIWQIMLQLWKTRNDIIHDHQTQAQNTLQQQILTERVTNCFRHKDQVTANDRMHIFNSTAEELLQKDTRTIKAWLTTAERVIRHIRRKSRLKNSSSRLLETYVNWKPIQNFRKAKKKKNDLNPP